MQYSTEVSARSPHPRPNATGQVHGPRYRWIQLALGIAAMIVISSPQYTWTLFIPPLEGRIGAGVAALQVTFSLLIVLQTVFSPVQAWL
ncbi:MAG: hypothetical protein ACRDXB_13450, partial [Actinomycetes bacterium]